MEALQYNYRHRLLLNLQSSLSGTQEIFLDSQPQDGFAKSANLVPGYFQSSHSGLKNKSRIVATAARRPRGTSMRPTER